MPPPLLCLDADVRSVAERFRAVFSKPPEESVVTVLLGLLECEGRRTLSGMLSTIAQPPSVSGLRRFLAESPWVTDALVALWLERFRAEMQPLVEAEREPQRQAQPKRRGRPKDPFVTGSVVGDDSTMRQPQGRNREGVGTHQSTTPEQRLIGHRLVAGRSVVLDRRCPLAPQWSRQEKGCESDEVVFQSAITRMETFLRTWEPVVGTRTPGLLDRWDPRYAQRDGGKNGRETGQRTSTPERYINEEVLLEKRGMGQQKKRSGRKVLQLGQGNIQSDERTKRVTHEA
jgi:hypothetical protein